jgi:HemY protein
VTRLIWFIVKLGLAIALLVWLADQPGAVRINWLGYEIVTTGALLAAAIFLLVAASLLIYRGIRWLRHGPRGWRSKSELQKLQRGQQKLVEGLSAVAAGDAIEAGRKAVAARKLLGTTTATRLLQAQAAQLAGDEHVANSLFHEMTEDTDGAVLGFRGLITTALRNNRWDEAANLAEQLEAAKPGTPWLQLIKLEVAARRGDWVGATQALKQALLSHGIAPETARFQQAVLHAAEAQTQAKANQAEAALAAAEQATRLQPHWLPAHLELAAAQMRAGHDKLAARSIERIWREQPHPALALLWQKLWRDSDDLARLKKFEQLCRHNPTHAESRIACAEAAIMARLWGEARRHLLALIGDNHSTPDRRAFRLLASIEQQEHRDHGAAARWLARAAEAPSEPQWLCQQCGGSSSQWQANCNHCGSFAMLEWRIPGQSRAGSAPLKLASGT